MSVLPYSAQRVPLVETLRIGLVEGRREVKTMAVARGTGSTLLLKHHGKKSKENYTRLRVVELSCGPG
jgi:hypothetical protein